MAPKVSIIVPIFNVGLYLEQCLHSLVNQTMSEIEIILVEDCSTDILVKLLKIGQSVMDAFV